MGIWRGVTFKEYIREELHCFAEGMLTEMKQDFKFSPLLAVYTASWWVSLEPQWLVTISLLQRQHINEYDSTVTKLLGNDAVDRWLKKSRER